MRLTKMVGRRLKEAPSDAVVISHQFTIRGGYARQVGSGIYSLLPLGKRVIDKIEKIIREEMNSIDGQEVLLPVVMPRELWDESGRYESVGSELLRFKDRTGKEMVLGMTHEEAVVHLARSEIVSYKQLPCMMYQIQTKFRDEPRSRAGLIRVREFTMKDAYSFHRSQEDLDVYYYKCLDAYKKIFSRTGLKNVSIVEADSGMMGGAISHEFMLNTPVGEDSLVLCSSCDYAANREIAVCKRQNVELSEELLPLEKVSTPSVKTIADVSSFLNKDQSKTGKAVFLVDENNRMIFVLIRGDLDVEVSKLKNLISSKELVPAEEGAILSIGCVPGFAGLIGAKLDDVIVVVDESIKNNNNIVVGANEKDFHYINFNFERDFSGKFIEGNIASVTEGDLCVSCGEKLNLSRGIEIGNIFQLGKKYSEPMKFTYLDNDQKEKFPIMGCYGIGVGRLFASIIEDCHDEYGPIWPSSVSPFDVQINALNYKKEEVKAFSDSLYNELSNKNIDVLFDDRDEKAGFQFKDADLMGIPLRIIVSPKTLKDSEVEFKTRDGSESKRISTNEIVSFIKKLLN
ncbi:MAG: proline--tRNA ligase [Planctomycetota bacterium]|nr:MAG: proline--tRNA ligase [Planctomycetota bacterium]